MFIHVSNFYRTLVNPSDHGMGKMDGCGTGKLESMGELYVSCGSPGTDDDA